MNNLHIRPIRDLLRARLIAAAVAKGASEADAANAVDSVASDRPLIDWLFNGGFEKLLELVMAVLALLLMDKQQTDG